MTQASIILSFGAEEFGKAVMLRRAYETGNDPAEIAGFYQHQVKLDAADSFIGKSFQFSARMLSLYAGWKGKWTWNSIRLDGGVDGRSLVTDKTCFPGGGAFRHIEGADCHGARAAESRLDRGASAPKQRCVLIPITTSPTPRQQSTSGAAAVAPAPSPARARSGQRRGEGGRGRREHGGWCCRRQSLGG